uniref:Uncharacterized protein n=1 Tax=Arundo donax TaxID=35708 RepID=A0A0A9F7P8_ARUDO
MRRMPMPPSPATGRLFSSTVPCSPSRRGRSGDLFFVLIFSVLLQSKAMELIVQTSGSRD